MAQFNGATGHDFLFGTSGADTLVGGAGNDSYFVNGAGDLVVESANGGTDRVYSSVTFTLTTNVESVVLTGPTAINGAGNMLNNILSGNSGANTLNGGTGADSMSGGAGNDTYVVDNAGDVVTESANEGVDTVQSSIAYTLGANVEDLTLTGTNAISGTGNALNNIIVGNVRGNVLNGAGGNDTLTGGSGDDTINGGSGSDTAVYSGAASDYRILRDVLASYDDSASNPAEFLRFTGFGGATDVQVRTSGQGSTWGTYATLQGVTNLVLEDMPAQGNVLL